VSTYTYDKNEQETVDVRSVAGTMDDMNDLNVFPSTTETALSDAVTFSADDRGFVYAIARRIVGNAEDADDVTQDALLLAYRYRNSFRGEARYRTWLYRIASTTALGHLRRRGRNREQLAANDESFARELVDPAMSAETALGEHEAIAMIQAALATLDPKYRDVMLMRADATEAECAERLGITVNNVKIRAHRARKQLAEKLAAAI
jgi:RNA polymerase sigma-70 factor (ECF subfamily)